MSTRTAEHLPRPAAAAAAPLAPAQAVPQERILLSAPDVGPVEEEYVLAALRSGWIAPAGPELDAFEAEAAARTGAAHAVALSSGTAALHLGLLCLGVKPGDAVVTSTLTFAATANAIVYCGARPVFADVEADTGNLDPLMLTRALDELEAAGQRVGAVVPVDMLGRAADYTRLLPIAHEHGVPVLADAAESLGAAHAGRPAGSFGEAAALSFNGNKIMTTSGGGMLLTDDAGIAARARHLSTQARMPVPHYEHEEVGFNYRLSSLLAALGRAQLTRLDGMIARRQAVRERYRRLFAAVPGTRLLGQGQDAEAPAQDNAWLTAVLVDPEATGWDSGALAGHLAHMGIETRPVWKPMHLQPVFAGAQAVVDGTAESLFRRGLALPSGSGMGEAELRRVEEAITAFLTRAGS
ncbi:DegT/DnrJ/EryC1/StrS family aminotransferase [Brevibacterium album]|uniref:DegT/DnrJ/EryC1/StrS family aminotransferase n=1 Tax=Brevibacterium album TaxID=417948 RepID=UPI0004294C65|nr:aminotransferase class I/II-fold pyridoxal phosphate-dependent enzyme [Brevibacterium album]